MHIIFTKPHIERAPDYTYLGRLIWCIYLIVWVLFIKSSNYWHETKYPLGTLQWRHNGRHGASNHRRLDCVLNRLFRCRSKKYQSSALLAFVRGIHRWIPRTRKMFPFDDAIVFQYRKYTWNTPLQNFGDFVLAYECYGTEIIIWTQVLKTQNTVVCGARLFQWKMYVMAFTSISYSYHGAAWCTGRWATREESKLLVCWMVFNHWWKDMGNYLMQNIWNAAYSFIVYPGIYSKMPMSEILVCNEYGSN